MTRPKILVADSISPKGVEDLARDNVLEVVTRTGLNESDLVKIVGDFSAIVVRSETKITAKVLEGGKSLRVIGRAGVGVDNVDVETATRRGIVVLNAPSGKPV